MNGSKEPNRAYVVFGNYDSRATDINDFTDDAPDDDASGVAVSMELLLDMNLRRHLYSQQGLFGSAFMAAQLIGKQDSVDAQAMLDIAIS